MLQVRRKSGEPILTQEGLVEDEEVIVPSLGGHAIAILKKDRYNVWRGENENFLYTLKFNGGEGWICDAVINRNAISRLKITS